MAIIHLDRACCLRPSIALVLSMQGEVMAIVLECEPEYSMGNTERSIESECGGPALYAWNVCWTKVRFRDSSVPDYGKEPASSMQMT